MWIVALLFAGVAAAAPATRDSTSYPSIEALTLYSRGRLLEERGDPAAALETFYRVLATDPRSVEALRRVSDLTGQQGEPTRSLEFADRALALSPDDARSLWLRGSALFNLGRVEESLQALNRAVQIDPENDQYWRTLAHVAEQQDQIDRVAEAYDHVVFLTPDDAESWFQLAGARARLGQFGAADTALAESRDLNPLRPGTDFLEGWIDEGLGRDSSAIALYTHHLTLHPDDVLTRQRLVVLLAGQKRYPEALQHAKKVRAAKSDDPEALETEADLSFRVGKNDDARARLAELQKLDPDDAQLQWRSALVLTRHKRGAEAVTLAASWTRAHPGDYRGPMLQARVYALDNDTEKALASAREAVSMAPDSIAARITLGRIAQQARRWPEAAAVWDSLHRRYPRQAPVAMDLAFCREQMGDVDGAVSAAREALAVAPGEATVLNFLGYLLADHNRDLQSALRMIQQALAQDPDNGAYIDSLGWVYYRLGRLAEARVQLELAVEKTHGDPVVLEHLGDVYRDLRMLDLARQQYRKSLAADGSNLKVRNKLEAIR